MGGKDVYIYIPSGNTPLLVRWVLPDQAFTAVVMEVCAAFKKMVSLGNKVEQSQEDINSFDEFPKLYGSH